MKKVGNINANAYYNPDEKRHPPPTNFIETERDSELEKYIRGSYSYYTYFCSLVANVCQSKIRVQIIPEACSIRLRRVAGWASRRFLHDTVQFHRPIRSCSGVARSVTLSGQSNGFQFNSAICHPSPDTDNTLCTCVSFEARGGTTECSSAAHSGYARSFTPVNALCVSVKRTATTITTTKSACARGRRVG